MLCSCFKGLKEIISSLDHIRRIRLSFVSTGAPSVAVQNSLTKLLPLFQLPDQGESPASAASTRSHLRSPAGRVQRVAERARLALFVSPRVPRRTTCRRRRPRPSPPTPSLHCSLRLVMALPPPPPPPLQKLLKSKRSRVR